MEDESRREKGNVADRSENVESAEVAFSALLRLKVFKDQRCWICCKFSYPSTPALIQMNHNLWFINEKAFGIAIAHSCTAWSPWQEGAVSRSDKACPHSIVQKSNGSSAGAQSPEPRENKILQEMHLDWSEPPEETVQRQESCRRVLPGCCYLPKSKVRLTSALP